MLYVGANACLQDSGNLLSGETTQTTPLEIWRSTDDVEAAWARRKKCMGRTVSSIGQSALEDKRFEFANGMYPNRWGPHKVVYEKCKSFSVDAKKAIFEEGPNAGRSVFNVLEDRFQQNVDMMDPLLHKNMLKLFTTADTIFRTLSNMPGGLDASVDIITMLVPLIEPLGTCALLPQGLGNPALSLETIKLDTLSDLGKHMASTKAYEDLREGGAEQEKQEKQASKMKETAQKSKALVTSAIAKAARAEVASSQMG